MNQQHYVEEWRASAIALARSHFKFETILGYSFGGGKANEA